MKEYLSFNRQVISEFSDVTIETMYQRGYVFTRVNQGIMDQTRSVRINLADFELSSENRRILRKMSELKIKRRELPLDDYHWSLGKMAKDFYDAKFGDNTFSANKAKELLSSKKSNFNYLYSYAEIAEPIRCGIHGMIDTIPKNTKTLGYAIVRETDQLVHYSYPFYDLEHAPKSMGMGMMLLAILNAKVGGKAFIYLGSAQRQSDTYKLQFKGLEWFDGKGWSRDLILLKKILVEDSD